MPCLSFPRRDTRWGLCSTQELRGVFSPAQGTEIFSELSANASLKEGGSPKMSLPGYLALALQGRHMAGSPTTLSGSPQPLSGYRHPLHPHAVGPPHFYQGNFGE